MEVPVKVKAFEEFYNKYALTFFVLLFNNRQSFSTLNLKINFTKPNKSFVPEPLFYLLF